MGRSDLIEHQKIEKDVWVLPSDAETKESRLLKALELENKLILIAGGVIIALFGFMVLTYGVYW
tara:strand:+ start:2772 stop:2963 length:192 start_codon:yes stop_codon:yes gene_type:complete